MITCINSNLIRFIPSSLNAFMTNAEMVHEIVSATIKMHVHKKRNWNTTDQFRRSQVHDLRVMLFTSGELQALATMTHTVGRQKQGHLPSTYIACLEKQKEKRYSQFMFVSIIKLPHLICCCPSGDLPNILKFDGIHLCTFLHLTSEIVIETSDSGLIPYIR